MPCITIDTIRGNRDVEGWQVAATKGVLAVKLHDDDKMLFGTHKGQRLGDVPDSYWRWFLTQDWCDKWPDLVEYANLIDEGE